MKRNILAVLVLFLLGICVPMGVVEAAGESGFRIVRKGETLSGMFGAGWKRVARINNISNPKKLQAGQKLLLAEGVVGSRSHLKHRANFRWNPGKDPERAVVGAKLRNLSLMFPDLPGAKLLLLADRLEKGERGNLVLGPDRILSAEIAGEKFRLENGIMGGGHSAIAYEKLFLRKGARLKKSGFSMTIERDRRLLRLDACSNSLMVPGPTKPRDEVPGPKPVVPPVRAYVERPLEKGDDGCDCNLNASGGIGAWVNKDASGDYWWLEAMLYCKVGEQIEVGFGPYLSGENGSVSASGYKWDGSKNGGQVGLKWNDYGFLYEDGAAMRRGVHQREAKLRLLYGSLKGENGAYAMHQNDWLLGAYLEDVRQVGRREFRSVSLEGYTPLSSSIESTWSGDRPQNRGLLRLSAYERFGISNNLDGQITLSGLYQFWDEVGFVQVIPSLRWYPASDRKLALSVSPWISVPILNGNGAGITKGITFGFDTFDILRSATEKHRASKIRAEGTLGELMTAVEAEEGVPMPTPQVDGDGSEIPTASALEVTHPAPLPTAEQVE
ncbi:MAG: LysM peptidoglycan-binding domain-containing protein [Candidatus Moranbacteria bacterium]|nr:LysM peptidoglycan-binding domain-containing protein [Candidatus Moranbacteria bacterium]